MKYPYTPKTNNASKESRIIDNQNLKDIEGDVKTVEKRASVAQSSADVAQLSANAAMDKANTVNSKADNIQNQVNALVVGANTSTAETVQARVDKDGITFATLKARIDSEATKIADKANTADVTKKTRTYAEIRKKYGKKLSVYSLPNAFDYAPPVTIMTDKHRFFTDYNKNNFKNTSANTIYVDTVNGVDNLTTGSKSNPRKTLGHAFANCQSGDTIIILDKIVESGALSIPTTTGWVNKSVNIIADSICKLICGNVSKGSYAFTTTANAGVYQSARSNCLRVVDLNYENGMELTKVATLAECISTKNTWYTDNTTVYVHPTDEKIPTDNYALLTTGRYSFSISNPTENTKVYIEGFDIYGGVASNIFADELSDSYTLRVILDNVKGLYALSALDAFAFRGGEIIANQCTAMHGGKDGFNYTISSSPSKKVSKFIEINCVGANNGFGNSTTTQNGSTCHAGCKGVRVNSQYFNNFGSNVADTADANYPNTKSVNLGCTSFDSACNTNHTAYNTDFSLQGTNCEMWIDGCVSFGSYRNISVNPNSIIHVWNTEFDTYLNGGTIDILNQI